MFFATGLHSFPRIPTYSRVLFTRPSPFEVLLFSFTADLRYSNVIRLGDIGTDKFLLICKVIEIIEGTIWKILSYKVITVLEAYLQPNY